MTYLKARQYVAWGGILIWMVVAAALWGLSYRDLWPEALDQRLSAVGLLMALQIGVGLPLDWLGGYWLPHRYARSEISLGEWFISWAKAAVAQALLMGLLVLVLMGATAWLGWLGALGWLAISMLLLLGFQFYLHLGLTWHPHLMENNQGRLLFLVRQKDRTFTGGIYGIPGKESIVYPEYWRDRFPEAVNRLLVARRHGAVNTGAHGRGVLLALGWNLLLFAAAVYLSPEMPSQGHGLLGTVGAFTLLSVLTPLLPLPWLSRRAVYEMDRWTYYQRMNPDDLRRSIELTHRLREDTGEEKLPLSRWMSTPSRARREAHFASQKAVQGAWQASRQANFASWAGFNLLNRSWPDQLGRPELWVFPPVD